MPCLLCIIGAAHGPISPAPGLGPRRLPSSSCTVFARSATSNRAPGAVSRTGALWSAVPPT
eukprot:7609355-Alexandrium_andersonii.AAC.1